MDKEKYTSKFNKSEFKMVGDFDPLIKDFLIELNKCSDITTIYSCEGHHEDDCCYIFFNVNDKGWDVFWQQIIPELSEKFCTTIPELYGDALVQSYWTVSLKSNQYNTGISIHYPLGKFLDGFGLEDVKGNFWGIISETFLKYFK